MDNPEIRITGSDVSSAESTNKAHLSTKASGDDSSSGDDAAQSASYASKVLESKEDAPLVYVAIMLCIGVRFGRPCPTRKSSPTFRSCSICGDILGTESICGHVFHPDCNEGSPNCPVCGLLLPPSCMRSGSSTLG